jgi:hypothetical protein
MSPCLDRARDHSQLPPEHAGTNRTSAQEGPIRPPPSAFYGLLNRRGVMIFAFRMVASLVEVTHIPKARALNSHAARRHDTNVTMTTLPSASWLAGIEFQASGSRSLFALPAFGQREPTAGRRRAPPVGPPHQGRRCAQAPRPALRRLRRGRCSRAGILEPERPPFLGRDPSGPARQPLAAHAYLHIHTAPSRMHRSAAPTLPGSNEREGLAAADSDLDLLATPYA